MSQSPNQPLRERRKNTFGFFQRIKKACNAVFKELSTIFKGSSQVQVAAITPLRVPPSFSGLNMHTPGELPGLQAVMSANYQLPQISFGQIKNDLVARNPELATMASAVQQTHPAQSWSIRGRYTLEVLKFTAPEQSAIRGKGYRAQRNSRSAKSSHSKQSYKSRIKSQAQRSAPFPDFGKIRNELDVLFPSFAIVPTKPHHPPEEFHLFKKLPQELQVSVWRHAMDEIGARIITLRPEKCSIPAVIQACRISRYEARKKFKFCVARQGFDKIYRFLDMEKDILKLPNCRLGTVVLEEMMLLRGAWIWTYSNCLPDVLQLALDLGVAAELVSRDRRSAKIDLWTLISHLFPNLKVLHVVIPLENSRRSHDVLEVPLKKLPWLTTITAFDIRRWPQHSMNRVWALRLYDTLAEARVKGSCKGIWLRFAVIQES